jgi:hypothetical protein
MDMNNFYDWFMRGCPQNISDEQILNMLQNKNKSLR